MYSLYVHFEKLSCALQQAYFLPSQYRSNWHLPAAISLRFAGSTAAQKMRTLLWQHTQTAAAMQIAHIAYAGMTKPSTNSKFQTKFAADNHMHTSCVSAAYYDLNWAMIDNLVTPMWASWDSASLHGLFGSHTHQSMCFKNSADTTSDTAAETIHCKVLGCSPCIHLLPELPPTLRLVLICFMTPSLCWQPSPDWDTWVLCQKGYALT